MLRFGGSLSSFFMNYQTIKRTSNVVRWGDYLLLSPSHIDDSTREEDWYVTDIGMGFIRSMDMRVESESVGSSIDTRNTPESFCILKLGTKFANILNNKLDSFAMHPARFRLEYYSQSISSSPLCNSAFLSNDMMSA